MKPTDFDPNGKYYDIIEDEWIAFSDERCRVVEILPLPELPKEE